MLVGKLVCPASRNQISVSGDVASPLDVAANGDASPCSWFGNPETSCVSVDCVLPADVAAAVCAVWAAGLAIAGADVNGVTLVAAAD